MTAASHVGRVLTTSAAAETSQLRSGWSIRAVAVQDCPAAVRLEGTTHPSLLDGAPSTDQATVA